mmetsp:Transcript_70615/g.188492  ORF Transcript_70615/g.188492 Transcript_70615/m.188492 type:complete len:86 (+) Transcript_70615:94-351(+)
MGSVILQPIFSTSGSVAEVSLVCLMLAQFFDFWSCVGQAQKQSFESLHHFMDWATETDAIMMNQSVSNGRSENWSLNTDGSAMCW